MKTTLTTIITIKQLLIDVPRNHRKIIKFFGTERFLEIHHDPEKSAILTHWMLQVGQGEMSMSEGLHCADADIKLTEYFATV